jgi:hypothetical protein
VVTLRGEVAKRSEDHARSMHGSDSLHGGTSSRGDELVSSRANRAPGAVVEAIPRRALVIAADLHANRAPGAAPWACRRRRARPRLTSFGRAGARPWPTSFGRAGARPPATSSGRAGARPEVAEEAIPRRVCSSASSPLLERGSRSAADESSGGESRRWREGATAPTVE